MTPWPQGRDFWLQIQGLKLWRGKAVLEGQRHGKTEVFRHYSWEGARGLRCPGQGAPGCIQSPAEVTVQKSETCLAHGAAAKGTGLPVPFVSSLSPASAG